MPNALLMTGTLAERMRGVKKAALGAAMGKSEDWARKVLDGESGVLLEDIPRLVDALSMKLVSKHKVCVDPEIAKAYEVIVARATQERDLLHEDAE